MRLSVLVKLHILKRAKNYNYQYPKNISEIISKRLPLDMLTHQTIVFLGFMDFGGNTLNAAASIPRCVVLNAEWAAELVFNPAAIVTSSLRMTIGHELTHQENDYSIFFTRKYLIKKNRQFIHWINEIHADFNGALRAFKTMTRQQAIESIKFKKQRKGSSDTSSSSHPSWACRLDYITNFDFDEKLIRTVATDVGCTDEMLIQDVIDHFKCIHLN